MIAADIVKLAQGILNQYRDTEDIFLSRNDALRLCRAIVGEQALHDGQWLDLDSSNLKRCRYAVDSSSLEIEFQSEAVWTYLNVPQEIYAELAAADSPGRYFASRIKGVHDAEKQPELD